MEIYVLRNLVDIIDIRTNEYTFANILLQFQQRLSNFGISSINQDK